MKKLKEPYKIRGQIMGMIKGQNEYNKFKKSIKLTRKQAILAMCFECNGLKESSIDCKAKTCPLYQYHPHRRL